MVKGDTHANLIFDIAVPAGDKRTENEIRDIVTGEIKKKNENYYCIITVDRNYTMDEKEPGVSSGSRRKNKKIEKRY